MWEKFDKAYEYAREKHKNQKRKVSGLPYLLHIYDVCQILMDNDATENAIIAGVLHDTIEDTGTTLDEIYANFGSEVAYIVDVLTEKKTMPYEHRKTLQAVKVKHAPLDVKMVKCADLLANMRSLKEEVCEFGESLWGKFNAPKEIIAKHHKEMIDAISELGNLQMYKELQKIFDFVFDSEKEINRDVKTVINSRKARMLGIK